MCRVIRKRYEISKRYELQARTSVGLYSIYSILLIILLVGCGNSNQNDSNETPEKPEVANEKTSEEKQTQPFYKVVINDFASTPFERSISTEYLKTMEVEFSRTSKEVQNKHTDTIDSVLRFTYKQSYFEFYKTSNNIFLQKILIKDDEIKVGNISLGMLKSDFLSLLGLKDVDESMVIVADEEEYSWHTFKFESNILSEIILSNNVD